ncbi:MAG: DNA methyltransferase [Candidatus Dojkabacteria bacterium]|nr:DNA methyltransferase [Candidatus Dojkabacteria bacterium]
MVYFFTPGRKWHLSRAELIRALQTAGLRFVETASNEQVFLFDIAADPNMMKAFFERLGGFIRFGEVLEDPFDFLEAHFTGGEASDRRVLYAVSVFQPSISKKDKIEKKMKLGMAIKKWLKEKGYRCRFVSKGSDPESSLVLLKENDVIARGFELVLVTHPKRHEPLWGRTLSYQDYASFSKRDYDRPAVNKKKGMIPPKLARMMVNLAGKPEGSTVWDPFCGSGTILMEALLLKQRAVGSDIDPVSIEETKKNLEWTSNEFWISHRQYSVFRHDITQGMPEELTFDCIVTEPYLGPVLRKSISINQLEQIIDQLTPLYTALENVLLDAAKTKPVTAVFVVPSFKTEHDWLDMEIPLPSNDKIRDITAEISSQPLQWDRPHSIIRRTVKIVQAGS